MTWMSWFSRALLFGKARLLRKGDDWATKEVAGRLLSLVHRLRLTRAISRHPRAGRFESLVRAIQRGRYRYTSRQLKLAQRLAAEAGA